MCGYYLGYDWTMIVKDLPNKEIFTLFRPELRAHGSTFTRVHYEGYQLHWLAGAMWLRDDPSSGKRRHVTIWDLGKYYQGPFVDAIKAWKIRPDVQDEIAAMKQRRSRFSWKDMPKIREYCMHECEALSELAGKLEQAHTDADLKPRGWFGPGSTASVLLNRHNIHERRGNIPPIMLEPVACAFFGGRAEISTTGKIQGPIWGYDVSSAYPYHASVLPCLEHGRWERVSRERAITGRGVVHALVRGHIRHTPGAWGPLPVRLANGSIVYPTSGASGWWWRDEWLAARDLTVQKGLEFEEAFVLRRECNCKPFAFLPELFARRLRVGKDSGEGKILKLGPNSVYGKLAQTIGKPQFASRVWAGMITSGTRAQILRLMARHKKLDSVLMIATDGLFSTEKISVDKTIVLGGWERAEHESITLIRPGIYWLGDQKVRARGLGRDNLGPAGKALLTAALERGDDEVWLARRDRFGGAKICVNGPDLENLKRSAQYGQWHTIPSHVSLAPAPKRTRDWSPPTLDDVESAPYGTLRTRKLGQHFEILEYLRDFFD